MNLGITIITEQECHDARIDIIMKKPIIAS